MKATIHPNEWYNVQHYRPPRGQQVLCRFSDGHFAVLRHNGVYWVGQHNIRIMEGAYHPTHFLLFEPFIEENEL